MLKKKKTKKKTKFLSLKIVRTYTAILVPPLLVKYTPEARNIIKRGKESYKNHA